ncbi:MAG: hypothetical protein ACTSRG_06375, partial [Candidatus Helarchaeota archaeon]
MKIEEVDIETFLSVSPLKYPQMALLVREAFKGLEDINGRMFALKDGNDYCGRVLLFRDTNYKSFNKSVCSFGWLYGKEKAHLEALLKFSEEFARDEYKLSVLRGPRNNPMTFCGQGIQTFGFDCPSLIGVPNNPEWYPSVLLKNKFEANTEYFCLRFDAPYEPLRDRETEVTVQNLTFDDLNERVEEFSNIYNDVMSNMPDVTVLKKESFASFLELYRIIKALDFIFVALCDDKVAGFAVLIPNLYDKWDGGKVSKANWLIGDVSKDMRGRVWNKIKNTVHRFLEKSGILSYEG